ncbi:hypothetical protein, partial [Litorivivens sp.]
MTIFRVLRPILLLVLTGWAVADSRTDWALHGRDTGEQRYSPLTSVNAENVNQLGLAWFFEDKTDRALEATPIV